MKDAPPYSHEIRYVFSVHGGILIAGAAMLLRNVALMVKPRQGSDCRRHHGSAGVLRRCFSLLVRRRARDCPACFPHYTTRQLLPNADGPYEKRSIANPCHGVNGLLVP